MPSNRGYIVKLIIDHNTKKKQTLLFNKWKENSIREFYGVKLKNAAMMVDKMSKFSRSFISLNSLSQIVMKNRQRVVAKSFLQWNKTTYKG